jgi:rhamnose utilization protein RhaD (predicted bifunctional aldolase and dehydrogenase)/NAD(P)-dependent dehydrogenase (short-subunit alcohol dehydrogenase family)
MAMKNRWRNKEAKEAVARYGARGIPEELALRVYTSRLIGSDPALVLHGGGNTSVKGKAGDVLGAETDVLYVKGSGWDLATIEPEGFPAVRMAPILGLRHVKRLSDEEMVNALRTNLLDASAPNPSVEALLHAFLPHRFVDHTHADAILALVDQPDPEARCAEVFGGRLAVLPFVFPGFALAGEAMRAYEADPSVEGIVLVKHGLFTFAETARESYERMIRYVALAERALGDGRRKLFPARAGLRPPTREALAGLAPIIRGALGGTRDDGAGGPMILHFRTSGAIRAFVDGKGLGDYSQRGVATPDHIIRTKNLPLLLPPAEPGRPERFARACRDAVAAYAEAYHRYFRQGAAASPSSKTELDPLPRVILLPGAGLFAAGATEADARIAADLYEHTITIIAQAEGKGRYTPLDPMALFEMEYWSLEQAKLGGKAEKPLARRIALITGAASGIGAATARLFAEQGAHLVLVDLAGKGLEEVAAGCRAAGVGVEPVAADVTSAKAAAQALHRAALRFGGLDILVSNAGAVWQGAIGDVEEGALRQSFALNFFAHQHFAAGAVRIFRAQGGGGQLLFNASKSAFNPGPGLGPYTIPKAAVIALMRQYALDYGELGVRSNAVNADRVPTALFGEGVLETRAKARGLSVDTYLSGNLLGRAVRPEDVARAFLHLALSERTTGTVLPVDGGNIAAAPR